MKIRTCNKIINKGTTANKELLLKPNKIWVIFSGFVLQTNFSLARQEFPSTGVVLNGRGGSIVALPDKFASFTNLIKDFCAHVWQTIKTMHLSINLKIRISGGKNASFFLELFQLNFFVFFPQLITEFSHHILFSKLAIFKRLREIPQIYCTTKFVKDICLIQMFWYICFRK